MTELALNRIGWREHKIWPIVEQFPTWKDRAKNTLNELRKGREEQITKFSNQTNVGYLLPQLGACAVVPH